MSALSKWARTAIRKSTIYKPPYQPLRFPTSGFDIFPPHICLEEESNDRFKSGKYLPVNIGDVFASKYQVIGKLGFGVSSTVWLGRDLLNREYVSLKIYARNEDIKNEFSIYQHIKNAKRESWTAHPGADYVRTAINTSIIPRAGGGHNCLVQKPMWESWSDMLFRIPSGRFTEALLKAALKQLLLALEFLHTECKIVHTDIKGDNVLHVINDPTLLTDFLAAELQTPSPRKTIDDHTVYASRRFGYPKKHGIAVLSDFGSTVLVKNNERRNWNIQPDIYRAPEVMIKADWSYTVDIWNVGCVV
ncbi:hypothetical protein HYALB_00005734 [Hymenoscyphus albidus]|uniref:Protein kinase domain-containing protein n=1 Tax=Hymenoscyphus albidus TaxID=595503 RepID=A0A9N9LPQ1_9HELO|nr:hypothetical protein HYALB_00005734 [Hymenoscyphus albidus]